MLGCVTVTEFFISDKISCCSWKSFKNKTNVAKTYTQTQTQIKYISTFKAEVPYFLRKIWTSLPHLSVQNRIPQKYICERRRCFKRLRKKNTVVYIKYKSPFPLMTSHVYKCYSSPSSQTSPNLFQCETFDSTIPQFTDLRKTCPARALMLFLLFRL